MVKAEIGKGKVTASAVASPGKEPAGTNFLVQPIHLDIVGGDLSGSAVLSFPVDVSSLPADVDPSSGWVSVYTREDGGAWEWAGGAWDETTQSLQVSTNHFSDWVYAATDFDEIARQQQFSKQQSVGFRIGKLITGDTPPLSCSSEEIPLGFAYDTPGAEGAIQACATRNPAGGAVTLQLRNVSSIPFSLTLPRELRYDQNQLRKQGIVGDFIASVMDAADDRTIILPAESKRDFYVPAGTILPRESVVTAQMSGRYWASDMANFGWSLATANVGRKVSPLLDVSKNALKTVKESKSMLDCLDTFGAEAQEMARLENDDERQMKARATVEAVTQKCFSNFVAQTVEGNAQRSGKIGSLFSRIESKTKTLGNIVDLYGLMKTAAKGAREETLGISALLAGSEATRFNFYVPAEQAVPRGYDLLPPERSDSDAREYIPVLKWFGMPNRCGGDFDHADLAGWNPELNTDSQMQGVYYDDAIGLAQGNYDTRSPSGTTVTTIVSVAQILDGHAGAARSTVRAWPSSCMDDYGIGGEGLEGEPDALPQPVWTEDPDVPPTSADAVRLYNIVYPASAYGEETNQLALFAVSDNSIISMSMQFDTIDAVYARASFRESYTRAAMYVDAFRLSSFTAR